MLLRDLSVFCALANILFFKLFHRNTNVVYRTEPE